MNVPFIVTYSLTRLCNLRCRHCYSRSGRKDGSELSGNLDGSELSRESAREIVRQIAQAGSRIIVLDGGEPLLREDIFELISYAKTLGLSTVLGTNGTLVTHDVARKLADSGLDHCAVSIDGAVPETHEWLRGVKGCFDAALNGARMIHETGIDLQINTCLHEYNEHELPEIISLAESLNARTLQLFFYVRSGRCDPCVRPPKYNGEQLEKVKRKISIRLIGDAKGKESKCCGAANTVSCILNDGTVYPCMLLPVPVGNVMKKTFLKILAESIIIQKISEQTKKMPCCELCRNIDVLSLPCFPSHII